MPYLSDIEEVAEVTEETSTKKGVATVESEVLNFSFRMSIDEEKPYDLNECSETAPTKTSIAPKSIVVSIDEDLIERLSNIDGDSDDGSDVRKSDLFCFSCCDLARACVITNAFYIVIMIFVALISFFETPNFEILRFDLYEDGDDYFYYENPEQRRMNLKGILALVRTGCAILFSVIGIIGAVRFQKYAVLSTAVWYCIYIVWSCVDMRIMGAAVAVFFAYPNWHLFFALRNGSITRDTYYREKYCCCSCCYNPWDYGEYA